MSHQHVIPEVYGVLLFYDLSRIYIKVETKKQNKFEEEENE